jgi:hypothetical protein
MPHHDTIKAPRFRLGGQLVPSPAKQIQAKSLDLLGFIRPNPDLSMGCSGFQIRILLLSLPLAAKRLARRASGRSRQDSTISGFRKGFYFAIDTQESKAGLSPPGVR